MKRLSRAVALCLAVPLPADASDVIAVEPGDNLAEIVERAPEGAAFRFAPGIYRLQFARPKDGQKFVGRGEVIFNGAVLLSDWHKVGSYWVAVAAQERRQPSGICRREMPLCGHSEDLFVDGKVYRRVGSLAEVTAGSYFDDGHSIHVSDDPTGKLIEFGVLPFAFSSNAEHVLLQDIVIEKYASAAQRGAIEFAEGRSWELRNVAARWNHGVGARIGPGTRIYGGSFSNNGQLGLGGGSGGDIRIENVEIAHNNYAGFRAGWEAGGTKFVRADGLLVRGACVHHNEGPGLWTDIDNINVEFADNLVFENTGDGIKHEISYKAKIHGNKVARNGFPEANWLWGSQILIQNSRDVEVYDNLVEVGTRYGNGISIINQNRGDGRYGPRVATNNFVHDNVIVHLGATGRNGMVADHEREWFEKDGRNLFESNTYVVPNDKHAYFFAKGDRARFSQLPGYGLEKAGKVEIATRKPLKLECPVP